MDGARIGSDRIIWRSPLMVSSAPTEWLLHNELLSELRLKFFSLKNDRQRDPEKWKSSHWNKISLKSSWNQLISPPPNDIKQFESIYCMLTSLGLLNWLLILEFRRKQLLASAGELGKLKKLFWHLQICSSCTRSPSPGLFRFRCFWLSCHCYFCHCYCSAYEVSLDAR